MPVFRELHALLKYLSKLKAIRGKYPKSSNNVNIGKNIAIGGSITAIIHVTVVYIPSTSIPFIHNGVCIYSYAYTILTCNHSNKLVSHPDG